MGWVAEELSGIDLGDQRLNARSLKLLRRLSEKPSATIPGACGGWAETVCLPIFIARSAGMARYSATAYGLYADPDGKPFGSALSAGYDGTGLQWSKRRRTGALVSYEAQRGMYLHPTLAVTPERLPLGVIDAWMWAREAKNEQGERPGLSESVRWIEGYERIAERAQELPDTRLVYVADREGDILALMQRAHALNHAADLLIRAKHNRKLPDDSGKCWDRVAETEVLGELQFYLPPRPGRKGRQIVQQIRALRVSLAAEDTGMFEVTALQATEVDPPAGEKPVEWRLLTNMEGQTLADAATLIDWYRCRWEIEMLFNILKNGCKVEALQLAAMPRIELALSLFMIVAWRIGFLMRLGRSCPDMDCEIVFDRAEWQAAWLVARKPLPTTPPKLNEAIRVIASFGGFLGRKGDGEPGVKSLWQGLQRVMDFAMAIRATRETQSYV